MREQRVSRPLDEVFAFFSNPRNLERITPDWVHFQILEPAPAVIATGTVINYRLRIRGLPLRWRTRIAAFDPPHRFVDVQERGPYGRWHHEHTFEAVEGGTLIRDRVEYRLRWWSGGSSALGRLVHRLLVRPDIERIFEHRRAVLETLLRLPSTRAAGDARVVAGAVP